MCKKDFSFDYGWSIILSKRSKIKIILSVDAPLWTTSSKLLLLVRPKSLEKHLPRHYHQDSNFGQSSYRVDWQGPQQGSTSTAGVGKHRRDRQAPQWSAQGLIKAHRNGSVRLATKVAVCHKFQGDLSILLGAEKKKLKIKKVNKNKKDLFCNANCVIRMLQSEFWLVTDTNKCAMFIKARAICWGVFLIVFIKISNSPFALLHVVSSVIIQSGVFWVTI